MNPTQERWLPVPGYEGYYEVSDHGNVRSVDRTVDRTDGKTMKLRGVLLSAVPSAGKYLCVNLCRDGVCRMHRVHRLVLEAFVGPRPDGAIGCHWDDNPANNHIENLRWGTTSDNMHDRVRNGRHYQAVKTHCHRGHAFTEVNTHVHPNGTRHCKACTLLRGKEYDVRRKASGVHATWTKTHCKHGHEFTPENTYVKPNGCRACRTCKSEANRRRRRRQKENR